MYLRFLHFPVDILNKIGYTLYLVLAMPAGIGLIY